MKLKALTTAVVSISLASCMHFGSTLEPEAVTIPSGPTVEQVSSEPLFYSVHSPDGQKRFLTLIKDCTPSKQKLPASALARQLLVGLSEVSILNQSENSQGAQVTFTSNIRAKLEGAPISLQVTTYKNNGCVFDMAIWAPGVTDLGFTETQLISIFQEVLELEGVPDKK